MWVLVQVQVYCLQIQYEKIIGGVQQEVVMDSQIQFIIDQKCLSIYISINLYI